MLSSPGSRGRPRKPSCGSRQKGLNLRDASNLAHTAVKDFVGKNRYNRDVKTETAKFFKNLMKDTKYSKFNSPEAPGQKKWLSDVANEVCKWIIELQDEKITELCNEWIKQNPDSGVTEIDYLVQDVFESIANDAMRKMQEKDLISFSDIDKKWTEVFQEVRQRWYAFKCKNHVTVDMGDCKDPDTDTEDDFVTEDHESASEKEEGVEDEEDHESEPCDLVRQFCQAFVMIKHLLKEVDTLKDKVARYKAKDTKRRNRRQERRNRRQEKLQNKHCEAAFAQVFTKETDGF